MKPYLKNTVRGALLGAMATGLFAVLVCKMNPAQYAYPQNCNTFALQYAGIGAAIGAVTELVGTAI